MKIEVWARVGTTLSLEVKSLTATEIKKAMKKKLKAFNKANNDSELAFYGDTYIPNEGEDILYKGKPVKVKSNSDLVIDIEPS